MVVPGPVCAATAAEMVRYGMEELPGPKSEAFGLVLST